MKKRVWITGLTMAAIVGVAVVCCMACGSKDEPTEKVVMLPNGDTAATEAPPSVTESPAETATQTEPIETVGTETVGTESVGTETVGDTGTETVGTEPTGTPTPTAVATASPTKTEPKATATPTQKPKANATATPTAVAKKATATPTAKPKAKATATPTPKPKSTSTKTAEDVTDEEILTYLNSIIGKKPANGEGVIVARVWIAPTDDRSVWPEFFDWDDFIANKVSGVENLKYDTAAIFIFYYDIEVTKKTMNAYLKADGWPYTMDKVELCSADGLLYRCSDVLAAYAQNRTHPDDWYGRPTASVYSGLSGVWCSGNCDLLGSLEAWYQSEGHFKTFRGAAEESQNATFGGCAYCSGAFFDKSYFTCGLADETIKSGIAVYKNGRFSSFV